MWRDVRIAVMLRRVMVLVVLVACADKGHREPPASTSPEAPIPTDPKNPTSWTDAAALAQRAAAGSVTKHSDINVAVRD